MDMSVEKRNTIICQDCNKMICRVYTFKDLEVSGYCRLIKKKVNGKDLCIAEYLSSKQLKLEM